MDYTIYILAEGKSSRMGTDKGLVKIKDQEMIAHCINNLKLLNKPIVIITSNKAYEKFGLPLISDHKKNKGPAQGIITALEDCKTKKCLIVSCDMPLVNELMIRQFDKLLLPFDIACYQEEFLSPFPGMYSKSILKQWTTEVENGNQKLQHLIPLFNYKSLPIDQAELFLNVNSPADIKLAAEKLK